MITLDQALISYQKLVPNAEQFADITSSHQFQNGDRELYNIDRA
jgi:hypothetical protein